MQLSVNTNRDTEDESRGRKENDRLGVSRASIFQIRMNPCLLYVVIITSIVGNTVTHRLIYHPIGNAWCPKNAWLNKQRAWEADKEFVD